MSKRYIISGVGGDGRKYYLAHRVNVCCYWDRDSHGVPTFETSEYASKVRDEIATKYPGIKELQIEEI